MRFMYWLRCGLCAVVLLILYLFILFAGFVVAFIVPIQWALGDKHVLSDFKEDFLFNPWTVFKRRLPPKRKTHKRKDLPLADSDRFWRHGQQ